MKEIQQSEFTPLTCMTKVLGEPVDGGGGRKEITYSMCFPEKLLNKE